MINQNKVRSITFNIHQLLIYLAKQLQHFNNAINSYMELRNKIIALLNLKHFLIEALEVKVHQPKLSIKDQLIIKYRVSRKNR